MDYTKHQISGLSGKNAWEEAQVEALADQWKDFTNEIRPYARVVMGMAEGDLEKLKNDVFLPAVQKHLPFFVKALKESGSDYLFGDSLTYVDLPVAEYIGLMEEKNPETLENFPELKQHREKVHSNPELKKWRETRPQTAFWIYFHFFCFVYCYMNKFFSYMEPIFFLYGNIHKRTGMILEWKSGDFRLSGEFPGSIYYLEEIYTRKA